MVSWLELYAPTTFGELAIPDEVNQLLTSAAVSTNPPHLLISGPAGVGKTASWRLVARQVLGPGWRSTSHVLQAKDLARSAGAMKKFEEFLRPGGAGMAGSLAGTSSLDAFDRNMTVAEGDEQAPAGTENDILLSGRPRAPVARLVIIEDIDHLGNLRQSYLRRMMESESHTSRFIFTARAPSSVMDALRSRCQSIRIPPTGRIDMSRALKDIIQKDRLQLADGLEGDLIHVAEGNLRKAIFLLEMLVKSDREGDRSALHGLISATTLSSIQQMLELALRGRVHEWKWETGANGRNVRALKGAMGRVDELMMKHALAAEDVLDQIHQLLTRGRLLLPEGALTEMLESLSKCDARLSRSMHSRIQIENMLHEIADIGERWALAVH